MLTRQDEYPRVFFIRALRKGPQARIPSLALQSAFCGLETVYSIDTAYRRASIDKAKPRHSALPLQPGVSGFGGFRSVGSAYLRDRIGRRGKLIEGKDRSAGAVRSPEEVMSYDSIITFQL
ncbi:hypothetical protein IG631_22557 [Alternaria alternata]|nr:hypothetical protein IG631_22557 [Alternaria alternata]